MREYIDALTQAETDGRVIEKRLMAKGWPPALAKAAYDPFDYALKLRNGDVIFFERADESWSDEWAIIYPHDIHGSTNTVNLGYDRGLDIRIADIVWACDAPFGS